MLQVKFLFSNYPFKLFIVAFFLVNVLILIINGEIHVIIWIINIYTLHKQEGK